jgi:hypothetical protein
MESSIAVIPGIDRIPVSRYMLINTTSSGMRISRISGMKSEKPKKGRRPINSNKTHSRIPVNLRNNPRMIAYQNSYFFMWCATDSPKRKLITFVNIQKLDKNR